MHFRIFFIPESLKKNTKQTDNQYLSTKMKKYLFPLLLLAVASCGPKWQPSEADGYKIITQKGGATLGYTSAPILEDKGYAFKDLNRNGQLDVYEDWRVSAREQKHG